MDLVTELPDTRPDPLPDKPRASAALLDGQETLVFHPPEDRNLVKYLEALKANTQLAEEQYWVIRSQQNERRALIETGRLVEEEANYLRRRTAELERDLEKERFWHDTDNLIHRLLLVPLLFLAF